MGIINLYVSSSLIGFGFITSCFSSTREDLNQFPHPAKMDHVTPLEDPHFYQHKVGDYMDRSLYIRNKKINDRISELKKGKDTLMKAYKITDETEDAFIELITPYNEAILELEELQSKITSKTLEREIEIEMYRIQEENFPQDDEASEESS